MELSNEIVSGNCNYYFYGKSLETNIFLRCAGLCVWSSRGSQYDVEIKLSEPLLKFRPRNDLIDTLLHEMIHAYVLILHRKADRDDHGPLFQAEMNRLNATAGTHITIYHSFFDL